MFGPLTSAKCVLVIPARRNSTRLRNKLLLRAAGKPILQHTFEAASRSKLPDITLVATDDENIAATAKRFGAVVVMTSPDCPSGTDRVAEAISRCPAAEIVVNLQGDEPEIDPESIDRLVESLQANSDASMATLATPIRNRTQLEDPSCVKVVFDKNGKAMYFSRSPIPYVRQWDEVELDSSPATFYQHVGIYAYRRDLLMKLAELPQGQTEKIEKLEQLRVLEQGESILVTEVSHASRGIDTLDDYAAFVHRRAG